MAQPSPDEGSRPKIRRRAVLAQPSPDEVVGAAAPDHARAIEHVRAVRVHLVRRVTVHGIGVRARGHDAGGVALHDGELPSGLAA
eukprot:5243990-Alexandrium_andersonii.AAC.1